MKIEKVNLTKENLLKIQEIDDEFFIDDKTSIDWYLERYTEKHIGYVLKNEENEYIGYIIEVPIKKELYDAITNGVLVNDININPKMFIQESNYHYIVSFVILEKYRGQGLGQKIIENISKVPKGHYCALTVSKAGAHMDSKYMLLKEQINENVAVYIMDINIKE